MKCKRCGNELRIGTEEVGIDTTKLPIFHRFGYCDICMTKLDLDLNYNQIKREHKKSKMRKSFAITNLILFVLIFIAVLTSDSGIDGNSRMAICSLFLFWCGFIQICGTKRKDFTIATIVLYSITIVYNLIMIPVIPAHIIFVILESIFLIFTSISLSKK